MALFRTSSGGGGGMTETVIWTNPSPSSSFSEQDIALSNDYNNYDLIKIYYKISSADTIADISSSYIYIPMEDFLKTLYSFTPQILYGLAAIKNGYQYHRAIAANNYNGKRWISFYTCYRAQVSASYNGYCIPTKISLCKI